MCVRAYIVRSLNLRVYVCICKYYNVYIILQYLLIYKFIVWTCKTRFRRRLTLPLSKGFVIFSKYFFNMQKTGKILYANAHVSEHHYYLHKGAFAQSVVQLVEFQTYAASCPIRIPDYTHVDHFVLVQTCINFNWKLFTDKSVQTKQNRKKRNPCL